MDEQLRRVFGSTGDNRALANFQSLFMAGASACGVPEQTAHTVWQQLQAFGSYSFPKSHATAFAVLVYQSAWCTRYFPAAFYSALLNNQPMGFWSPSELVGDARRHGVRVLPVDIELSEEQCIAGKESIRLGFRSLHAWGDRSIERLCEVRRHARFQDLSALCRRTRLPRRLIEQLILAGALDRWRIPRRTLLWQLGTLHYQEEELDVVYPIEDVALPQLTRAEWSRMELEVLGFSVHDHLMALRRRELAAKGILGSQALMRCRHLQSVCVAGLLVIHQAPPTARGHHFLTLEDEHGMINVVVRPNIVTRYRSLLHTAQLLLVW